MESYLTPSTITFVLGIMGVVFTIYHYFKNPQIETEKTDLVLGTAIAQLQKDFANLKDNHIHTLETKIDDNRKDVNNLAREVTRLATIIDERIPKR